MFPGAKFSIGMITGKVKDLSASETVIYKSIDVFASLLYI